MTLPQVLGATKAQRTVSVHVKTLERLLQTVFLRFLDLRQLLLHLFVHM